MKKIYIASVFALLGSVLTFAQGTPKKMANGKQAIATKFDKKYLTGFENITDANAPVPPSAFARGVAKSLGFTNYDLQTNGSMKPRIVNLGGGKVAGAWTYGTGDLADGVADRGTGYNTNASGAFLPEPQKRIESVRTGFTNLCLDSEGTQYTFAHGSATGGGFKMVMNKKAKTATTWTQYDVPSSTPSGVLWANVAIGGANGKTIHMAATTDQPINNMTRAMLYFRSTDGGVTWDKKDVFLPEVDATNYSQGMDGDAYVVTSKGNTVAIAFFGSWEDTKVWISQDNGDTWTVKTAYNFPLDGYVVDAGYDSSTLPLDPNAPTADAIFTSDQSGTVFIDKNGKVHIIFGRMYVADTDNTDGAASYYPGTSSFIHWDETFPPDSLQYLEAWPDKNNNDSLDVQNSFGHYYTALTSYPSTAVGLDGTIYLVYSALDELTVNADGNHYRHIFVKFSKDNGKTWNKTPLDIISDPKYLNPKDFDPTIAECVFPSVAPTIDNGKLHILYQIDDSQGLHVRHPTDETIDYSDNYFYYTDVDINELTTGVKTVAPATFDFTIAPNPAREEVRLAFDLKENSDVKVAMTDMTGRMVKYVTLGTQSAGKNSYNMSLDVPAGLYFVQLNINGQIATQKVVVR